MSFWLADSNLNLKLEELIQKYHHRLSTPFGDCKVAVVLTDSKPFIEEKINWGKVKKVDKFNKIWINKDLNYCIIISSDLLNILKEDQKEAILDLHLSRIRPQYQPKKVIENGKKITVKDQFGRIEYTNDLKLNKDGSPKWLLDNVDLQVFGNNIKRFGFWCEDLMDFKEAIKNK
jgi:hypothetical protein